MLNKSVTPVGPFPQNVPQILYTSAVKVTRPASVGAFTFVTIPILGGTLGPNGWLEVKLLASVLNTADVGTRNLNINIGASIMKQWGSVASQNTYSTMEQRMWNRNSESSQVCSSLIANASQFIGTFTNTDGTGNDAGLLLSGGNVNTSNNLNLTITHTSINAADVAHMHAITVQYYHQS